MLVLSRKYNERCFAIVPAELTKDGKPILIAVTVVEIRGERVRLGLEAPQEVKLLRDEHQLDVDEMMGVSA